MSSRHCARDMMALMQQLTLCTALLMVAAIVSNNGQFLPGPRYSLDNMPKTGFTCRDKILGGYYADSETQCQMFHVCVKVAGVGVQDFRFLCPNGTAFDQEAQICADWGDVDCEAATLYYGSDNFDLYRLGSGFESKRAPFAEEEEATFHLQRAETSDARRSKQYIVNQSSKPQQPPSPNQIPGVQKPSYPQQPQQYFRQPVTPPTTTTTSTTASTTTTTTTTTTPFTPVENIFYKTSQAPTKLHQKHTEHKQHQLLLNQQQLLQAQHFRQLTAAAATATPADHDEIFRGSHSSHFYNNRNNGKEDYEEELYRKSTTTPRSTAAATGANRASSTQATSRGRNRGRGSPTTVLKPQQSSAQAPSFGQAIVSTPAPFAKQPAQPQSRGNTLFFNTQQQQQQLQQVTSSTTQPAPQQRFGGNPPATNNFKITVTSPQNDRQPSFSQPQQQFNFNALPRQQAPIASTTSASAPVNNPFQFFAAQTTTTTVRPRSTFDNRATERSFDEGAVTTPQESQRIRPQSRTFNVDPNRLNQFNYNEYQGSRTSTTTTTTSTTTTTTPVPPTTFAPSQANFRQRAPQQSSFLNPFFSNPSTVAPAITTIPPAIVQKAVPKDRYQSIQRSGNEGHTPSTVKKFSTLVPKDQYNPTTFKPNAISKKALLQFVNQKSVIGLEKSPFTDRVSITTSTTSSTTTTTTEKAPAPATTRYPGYIPTIPPVTSTSTTTTTRAPFTTTTTVSNAPPAPNRFFQPPVAKVSNPLTQSPIVVTSAKPEPTQAEIDEDDGQYHPELYEKDFYRNRVKAKAQAAAALAQARNTNGLASLSTSDEEEIFRTAHSQNIAASGNDLILERARQAAARINEFFSSSSVKPTTTARKEQLETVTPKVSSKQHHHSKDSSGRTKSSHGAKGSGSTSNATPRPFSKAPTIPPNATITKRPPEDDSYDYAYYDSGSPDVPEYDIIEDFGRKRV
uniref:Chitin-binding type-2 domain-containing protein n=1 Tax=Anopheles merus TaxID=30066 RepID=A0A182UUV1_ANOME